jgi:selenide,water dikinase
VGARDLALILSDLRLKTNERLLTGVHSDAAVYRMDDGNALVFTVDFFPPVVDDPYDYGRIAAATSLSDVYAMGARPFLALNICTFPVNCVPLEVLTRILQGGADKVEEAGALVVGGQTIEDAEPKYGLAVVGLVDPASMFTKAGARPGDRLVLTKPLGTGLITTAHKAGEAAPPVLKPAVECMCALNSTASAVFKAAGIKGCTDITGFGLMGHLKELLEASGVSARIESKSLRILAGAMDCAKNGFVPAGTDRNRDYVGALAVFANSVTEEMRNVIFDPQTSGGLLACVPEARAKAVLKDLRDNGVEPAVIGEITDDKTGMMKVD